MRPSPTIPMAFFLSAMIGSVAFSQETATDSTTGTEAVPAEPSTTPEPAGDPAIAEQRLDIREKHGDWEVRCAPQTDDCFMYQLAKDATGNPVAEFNLVKIEDGTPAAAGVNALTPLGTLLPRGLVFKIDSGDQRQYPFTWCDQAGCVARFAFGKETVNALRQGANATITLHSIARPDQAINLQLSLSGFTSAFEMLKPVAN